jgi:hypothetical protein
VIDRHRRATRGDHAARHITVDIEFRSWCMAANRGRIQRSVPRHGRSSAGGQAEQHCAQHGPRQVVGYDLTETLEFERPKLRVRVTKYPKFVCQDQPQCGVVQPPRPGEN